MLLQQQKVAPFLAYTSLTVVVHCGQFYSLTWRKFLQIACYFKGLILPLLLIFDIPTCETHFEGNRTAASSLLSCHVAFWGDIFGPLRRSSRRSAGSCVFTFRLLAGTVVVLAKYRKIMCPSSCFSAF